MEVSRDYSGTNASIAMNAIEHEMAHLLSRNFALRPSANDNVARDNISGIMKTDMQDVSLEPTHMQNSIEYKDAMKVGKNLIYNQIIKNFQFIDN